MYPTLNRDFDFSEILATVCLIESAEYVEIIGKPRGSDNVRDDLSDNFADETHQITDIRCIKYYQIYLP